MEALAQRNWTDDRLEERFDRLDGELTTLRREMKEGHAELRQEMKEGHAELRQEMKEGSEQLRREMKEGSSELRAEMQAGDAGIRAEIATLNRVLIQGTLALVGALVVGILTHLL